MSVKGFDRRTFLRAATGLALGAPLLESLLPTPARAQAVTSPRRFVAMQTYSGQVATSWLPTQVPAGYRLRNAVFPGDTDKGDGTTYLHQRVTGGGYASAPLTDFATPTGISTIIGAKLNPYLAKLNLVRGIDFMAGAGHNSGSYFGNVAACTSSAVNGLSEMPTIDRVLAYSNKFYPSAPVLRALDVGTGMPSSFSYTDYGVAGGPVEQVSFVLDPRQAWNRAFGAFMAPSPTPRANPNLSLINSIHGDYARLNGNRRLSAGDKQLLERHMTFLDELERKLNNTPTVACTVPTAPRSIPNAYPWEQVSSIADFQDTVRLLAEVSVAALRCDVTRVVTFDLQKAITTASGTPAASFHNSADVGGDWHQFAHDLEGSAVAKANFVSISQFAAAEVFGRFVELLDVEEANGKTFLDNSLVLWGNELGYNHYNTDVMTLMAGGAGGAIKTGQYLDYIDWNQSYANPISGWGVLIPGVPHNRLLVSVLQAMGLSSADYERGGLTGYGHAQYLETPYNWPRAYDLTRLGQPLPGLMA